MTDGNTYAINRPLAEREEYDMHEIFEAVLADAEAAQAYAEELEVRVAQLEAELFELKNAPISFLLDHGKGE
jgi:hypothetical protein